MKPARLAFAVTGLAAAAVATLAYANHMVENKVLEDGTCYSPQDGPNNCNLTERYRVITKRQICTTRENCGVMPDGRRVTEIWQIEVE